MIKKATIVGKAEVSKEVKNRIRVKKLEKMVIEALLEGIGKEIQGLINSEDGKEIVEKTTELTMRGDIHKIELTLVNGKDLIKLEEEKEKLEKENDELKEKIKAYESIGLGDVLEAMMRVEIATEFANKLQELSGEYCERLG